MYYDIFPDGVFHVENAGGMIDEVLNQRVWIGCFFPGSLMAERLHFVAWWRLWGR
jgi:hypothetical protein